MCTCGTTSASGQYHTSLVGPAVQHARRCPCHHFSSIPSTILTFAVQGRNLAATEPRHFGVADAVDDGADAACESHLVGVRWSSLEIWLMLKKQQMCGEDHLNLNGG